MRIEHIKKGLALGRNRLALAWRLARYDLASRRAAGAAAALRSMLAPLLCILVVLATFVLLARGRAGDGASVALFVLSVVVPVALWSFLADVVVRSAVLLREQGYPVRRTAFPPWMAPLLPLAAAAAGQLAVYAIVAVLAIGAGLAPASSAGLFLGAWLASVALTAGLAFAAAAVLKAWHDAASAGPVDQVDNLVRSVPAALRKLKREAAELRHQNLVLAGQVDARLRRLEQQQAASASASLLPLASVDADTNNANHRTQE